jgi:hypothetical protein
MKKLIALILSFLVLSCSILQAPNIDDVQSIDFDRMEWTGWCKDKDSINHNILYAPVNDSINVMVLEVTY